MTPTAAWSQSQRGSLFFSKVRVRYNTYWQKKRRKKKKKQSERQVREFFWPIDFVFRVMALDQSPGLTESSSSMLKLVLFLFGVVAFCLLFFINQFVVLIMVIVSVTSNAIKSGSKPGLEDWGLNALLCSL